MTMGTTPIYQLPWPEQSDPPDGPVQIKALADRTELSLGAVRGTPTLPTFAARGVNEAALPGNRVYSTVRFQTQRFLGTAFLTMAVPATGIFQFTTSGVYDVYFKTRLQNPSVAVGYAQVLGTGVPLNEVVQMQPWSDVYCDLETHEYVEIAAGQINTPLSLRVQSQPNIAFALSGTQTRLMIKRLGDIGSVVPGPG
jgi:hypothetical protein